MDLFDTAKNVGTLLATAATIAYVSGYLILRARANALGTDPGFVLVDEAYVFAGFRFLFITLIVAVCLAPGLILVHYSADKWLSAKIASSNFWTKSFHWSVLFLLSAVTLLSLKIVTINGLLLEKNISSTNSKIVGAIMGTHAIYAVFLTFGIVFLAAVSAYWLKVRFSSGLSDPFTWCLCTVVTLLFFMLPTYHGALFADRKVRVINGVPPLAATMVAPVGIVDHTKDHYTLFGNDAKGNPCLTTVKQDSLFGYPATEIVRLNFFVQRLAKMRTALESKPVAQNSQETTMTSNPSNAETEAGKSFFRTLMEQLHMVFESIGSLGNSVVEAGQLWSVQIDAAGKPSKPKRLGTLSDLAWPVMGHDGTTIFALQKGSVVKLADNFQAETVLNSQTHWIKLLGTNPEGAILGVVYQDNKVKPAILDAAGDVHLIPTTDSAEDQARLAKLLQEPRAYTGGRALLINRSERGGRGFDVYFKSNTQGFNLSDCGDDSCGQASISPDFKTVLFIRQPRF